MAFATIEERKKIKEEFGIPYTIQFRKNGRESEIQADDVGHALDLYYECINKGSQYVEIFRILHDGTTNPTIGGYYAICKSPG